jgi:hypothetical protein
LAKGENGREKSFILQVKIGSPVVENIITFTESKDSKVATAWHELKMAEKKV